MLLQVELPQAQHTVVRVQPSIPMGQLLAYICGKRNIDPAHHRFDLPVTEESLAQRSLQQLKINSIKVIAKGQCQWVGSRTAVSRNSEKNLTFLHSYSSF